MGSVKFSGIGLTDIYGAVGARVLSRNFYGAYVKARIAGPAVISPALSSWQGLFSFVHAAYEALTDIERNEWIGAASSREVMKIDPLARRKAFTGFHLFMHLNLRLALIGAALISSPPSAIIQPLVQGFTVNIFSPVDVATLFSTPTTVTTTFALYASAQLNAGRMSFNQIYTFMAAVSGSATGWDVIVPYTARFGLPVSGKKIFMRIDPINNITGVRGRPAYCNGIVS